MVENLFVSFDKIMEKSEIVRKYAIEHSEEIVKQIDDVDQVVITTRADGLGLASPSLIEHHVIRGYKRGKVIKQIPENGVHSKIYYRDHKFIAIRSFNSYGSEESYYTLEFDGYIWAVIFYYNEKKNNYFSVGKIFRLEYDEKGRILSFFNVDGSSVRGEIYEYPEDESQPINVNFYYYVPGLSGSSKDIPAGYPNSPMRQYYYEVSCDQKVIREYVKAGEEKVFNQEYAAAGKKQVKPKPEIDTYEKLKSWLDDLLPHIPDGAKGLFFCLDEGTEDGFNIALYFTSCFDVDDEDWACDSMMDPEKFFISTDGCLAYQKILKYSIKLLRKYIKEKSGKEYLKTIDGIGAGFSDGDITVIYKAKKKK